MKSKNFFSVLLSTGIGWWTTTSAQVQQVWVARLSNGAAAAMKADSSGNAYVTGSAGTVKYDNNGSRLWLAATNPGVALALDGAGNVYVAGALGTAKLGANGQTVWFAPWNGSLVAIALDNSTNVYVTGTNGTAKFDHAGNLLWLSPSHFGFALGLDNGGNLYVAGASSTVKLDPAGQPLWFVRWTNGSLTALAVDSAGNAYVTGSDGGYVTAKYDTSGMLLWLSRYNGRCDLPDVATAIAVDAMGNVVVTGRSSYEAGSCFSRGHFFSWELADALTIKYDSFGGQLWVSRHRSSLDVLDWPLSYGGPQMALDGAGNVFVSSTSWPDSAIVRYDADGHQRWQTSFAETGINCTVALDNAGNVLVSPLGNTNYATAKYVQTELPGLPRITAAPQSQIILTQAIVTLSVSATGGGPLAYQWLRNRQPISAATNATLVLTNPPRTADYAVEVTNILGMTVSPEARVTNLRPITLCCAQPGNDFGSFGLWMTVSGPGEAFYELLSSSNLVDWHAASWELADASGVAQVFVTLEPPKTFNRALLLRPNDCYVSCGQ